MRCWCSAYLKKTKLRRKHRVVSKVQEEEEEEEGEPAWSVFIGVVGKARQLKKKSKKVV
jgi:hypothetical protein